MEKATLNPGNDLPRFDRSTSDSSDHEAELGGIFETSIYTDDLRSAEKFYAEVLGLSKVFEVPGRQLVFRCGASILLVFDSRRTQTERVMINGGAIPLHGATGAGHIAFRVGVGVFASWRSRFATAGVGIESEVAWPNGGHSLYFRDPAGNSLELATPNLWTDHSTPNVL
jgi:catechol 2,3-dioxygenase-like lactoylglutathione lyase family enzyme